MVSEEVKTSLKAANDITRRCWDALTAEERKAWIASGQVFMETVVIAGHKLFVGGDKAIAR